MGATGGVAAIVKVGVAAELTLRITTIDCVGAPLVSVAVTVNGKLPVGVVAVVLTVSVDEPEPPV